MTDALPFDVRAGMTSASNAHADSLCAGRHFAQRGAPLPPESKDARAGTLVHKAFAGADVELDRQQRKTFNRGRYLEFEMARRFFNEPLTDEEILAMAHRNQRYWLHQHGIPIHSGEVDALWFARDFKAALIEDQKALFGDVQDATDNMQLRDYVCLVAENFPELESVSVFINQPNVRWKIEDQLLVTYSAEDLRRAHADVTARVLRSNSIDATREPGLEQCKFCRAAGTPRCPESQVYLLKASDHAAKNEVVLEDGTRIPLGYATPAERGRWLLEVKAAEAMIKKTLEAAKASLKADPAWAEGWEITAGKVSRVLKELVECEHRLMEYFGEQWDAAGWLDKCCKISVPKFEEWFCAAVGGDEKEALQTFNLLFDSLIERDTSEGSLAKVKAKK